MAIVLHVTFILFLVSKGFVFSNSGFSEEDYVVLYFQHDKKLRVDTC